MQVRWFRFCSSEPHPPLSPRRIKWMYTRRARYKSQLRIIWLTIKSANSWFINFPCTYTRLYPYSCLPSLRSRAPYLSSPMMHQGGTRLPWRHWRHGFIRIPIYRAKVSRLGGYFSAYSHPTGSHAPPWFSFALISSAPTVFIFPIFIGV